LFAANKGKRLEELTEDDIRHHLKETYKEQIFDLITNPEKLVQDFPEFFEGVDPGDAAAFEAAVQKARHQAVLEAVDLLHLKDGTNLSERWYTELYASGSRTQVTIDKDKLDPDVELTKTRQADNIVTTLEQRGGELTETNTIKDVKSHTGELTAADQEQYKDYKRLIGNEVPLKDGTTIKIDRVTEGFLRPEGGAANARLIAKELAGVHGQDLGFEVFNSKGERWEISKEDVEALGVKGLEAAIVEYCSQ
jgi:hypothetical protein